MILDEYGSSQRRTHGAIHESGALYRELLLLEKHSPSDLLSLTAFLSVKSGDFVIAEIQPVVAMAQTGDW